MPIRDLNEEQFVEIYKEILDLDDYEDTENVIRDAKIIQLKVLFEIAKELRDLNRRLQDGVYMENPEEQQERITAQVLAILNKNKEGKEQ
jgi:hypothetical protein